MVSIIDDSGKGNFTSLESIEKPLVARSTTGLTRSGRDSGLRYRTRSLWLVCLYLPVLIIPWVLRCLMIYRPVMLPSYINQKGAYTSDDFENHERWNVAVSVINRMAAVLGVPVVSAMLAQGAVIFSQRRKESQELSVGQLFALADRGWIDVKVLWDSVWSKTHRIGSPYLWFGAALISITALQPPLQSLLLLDESMVVVTCSDDPIPWGQKLEGCNLGSVRKVTIAHDPEPQQMEHCPQNVIIQKTLENTINVGPDDIQMQLWTNNEMAALNMSLSIQDNSFYNVYNFDAGYTDVDIRYFASSMINGSTTGVLREHAAMMDSSASCVLVDDYPERCAGNNPFATRIENGYIDVAVCAEGSFNEFPWTRSRNMQHITERLWLDLKILPKLDSDKTSGNFTMRCEAKSRRGWFELGNYMNRYFRGPMLEEWPSQEDLAAHFNDYASYMLGPDPEYPKTEEEAAKNEINWSYPADPFHTNDYVAAGPLMSSALALFGNTSFFYAARESSEERQYEAALGICQSNRIPFWMYTPNEKRPDGLKACESLSRGEKDPRTLSQVVEGFLELFRSPKKAEELLEISMFFANEALLTSSATSDAREITSSPGHRIVKPQKTIPGAAIISVLIGLQIMGLATLLRFIYSRPAWTGYLDADALVQIGVQMKERNEGLDMALSSGLIGVVNLEESDGASLSDDSVSVVKSREWRLGLGAPGIITERHHRAPQ